MRRTTALLLALALVSALCAIACGSSATTSVSATAPSTTRCQPSIRSSSSSFAADGGSGTLTVTVSQECQWTAASQAPWIQVTSGSSGQGGGTVGFRVSANADPVSRHAAIVVADQSTDLTQAAAPCRFDVSAPSSPFAAAGGQAAVDVKTHQACAWTAAADASWVAVSPASGQGPAQITVTAGPNAGAERTVTLTIGQGRVTLRQVSSPVAPPPVPAPSPAPAPAPPPPSPAPAPAPTAVEVKGRIDNTFGSCPDLWLTIDDQTVHVTDGTQYKKDQSCRDLRKDKQITASGTMQTFGDRKYLLAQSIEIKK